jgi:hypothetical protein
VVRSLIAIDGDLAHLIDQLENGRQLDVFGIAILRERYPLSRLDREFA